MGPRGYRNTTAFEINEQFYSIRSLPTALKDFTILQLSDLHLPEDEAEAKHIISALCGGLNTLNADVCVITGDIRQRTAGPFAAAVSGTLQIIQYLALPTYVVLGNHDSADMVKPLEAAGIKVLMNEHQDITIQSSKLRIAGIDDPDSYQTHDIETALACSDEQSAPDVTLLLSHSPDPLETAANAGIDLFLCGHTHGGQICLPGGIPIVTNCQVGSRYARGRWAFDNMQGYTHRGCGSSIIKARFNCPPEIAIHKLQRA